MRGERKRKAEEDGKEMGAYTTDNREREWAEIIKEYSRSGKSKKEYCREKGISEKQFYYHQRRIREGKEKQRVQEGDAECSRKSREKRDAAEAWTKEGEKKVPDIVKLKYSDTAEEKRDTVSFIANRVNFTIPENMPEEFLAKLLKAVRDDTG